MKRSFYVILYLFLSSAVAAQSRNQVSDSINYYQKQLGKLYKASRDSFYNNAEFKEVSEKIRSLKIRTDDYSAFMLHTSFNSIDFTKFNSDNFRSGFNAFSGNMYSIGIGFSGKKKRQIFDFEILSIGIRKKEKKEMESISINSTPVFFMTWGYDIVKSRKLNIYPYVGIGLAGLDLKYESPATLNDTFSNITTIVVNDRSIIASHLPLSYKVGLGIEYVLSDKSNSGGTIFFCKAGTTRPFRKRGFDIEGIDYDPTFKFGELNLSVGFKFFGR